MPMDKPSNDLTSNKANNIAKNSTTYLMYGIYFSIKTFLFCFNNLNIT